MKKIIESEKMKKADIANAKVGASYVAPFYSVASALAPDAVARTAALFWSVFGPAARYDFGNPEYAYAVSLKP